jgi:hypothetical protein
MAKFSPTRKNNPCLICGNTSGKCRTSEINFGDKPTTLHLCMGFPDDVRDSQFKYLGLTKDRLWGKYIQATDWSEALIQSKGERLTQERQERDRLKQQQRLSLALSVEERDKTLRKLHDYIQLSNQHRKNLRERGLSDSQINAGYFFSVVPYQKIPYGIPLNFPGVDFSGQKLWLKDAGIICPAFDPEGRLIGAQLRRDNPSDDGRYRWLGNGEKSSHLPNGELPLSFCRPLREVKRCNPALAEGFLKSFIAAQKLGQICIGASGGLHQSSLEQLRQYLEAAKAKAGEPIDLYPDAGDVCNRQVLRRWAALVELLSTWGYSNLRFGWWGQVTKNECDIDELEDTSAIAYISPQEFFALGAQYTGYLPEQYRVLPDPEPDIEPDTAAYAAYTGWEDEQEQIEEIAVAFDKERRKQQWLRRLERELNPHPDAFVWSQRESQAPSPQSLWELGYQPSLTVHQRYLNLADIDASFLCVVSAMNTGKTHALAQFVDTDSLLIICNTIALTEALAARYNCRCYNEDGINLGAVDRLAITADSLWRVPTFNKRFKRVVIDEADQVTAHLTNGFTCKRNRERILAVFTYFAATAEQYILADADLSGPVIDWHCSLRGTSPFILKNTFQPNQGRIAYQFSSQAAAFEYGCQRLEEGKRVLFVCDSKTTVKKSGALLSGVDTIEGIENLASALGEKLATRFPHKKGQVIHGDNSGHPDVRNFIKNINASLKSRQMDYLAYNSTMQSGISIDYEAFDEVICLFTSFNLTHTELGQLAHRYRPVVPINFWIAEGRTGLETNCYKIASNFLHKNWASGLSLRIDPNTGMVGTDNPEFLQLVSSLEARRNWSLMNIQAVFKAHLEKMGYQIVPHPDEEVLTGLEGVKEELKQRKRVVEAAEIATICKSPLLTSKQYESLSNKPNPDFYERCQLQKFDLHEFYGMEVTEELIQLDDFGQLRRKFTRLDLLLNPESIARRMDLSDRRKHRIITDLKHYKLQRDLLLDLGLLEFIDPECEYQSSDLVALGERARLKAPEIKALLGITISVAPRYLKEGRRLAHKALRAILTPGNTLQAKWLLSALSDGTTASFADKQFENQEQANEYCSRLSPVAQLICEAIAIEKRFKARESTDSQIHADLCATVGLKRSQTRQTRVGRFYQITAESWELASSVLVHRQKQRQQWMNEREKELEQSAKRFQHLHSDEMQAKIEAEIEDNRQRAIPPLVFLAECLIKTASLEASSHPPDNISIYDFLGGGVTQSEPVTPGQRVELSQRARTEFGAKPVSRLPIEGLTVEQLATGRDDFDEYHDYLKIKSKDSEAYWVPTEWIVSPNGLPVGRDPDAYTPRIPGSTLLTWRNWLLGVRSLHELEQFERKRKSADLQAVVDSLEPEQLVTVQQRFKDWGIERAWLPPEPVFDESVLADVADTLTTSVELGQETLAEVVKVLINAEWFHESRRQIWNYLSRKLKAAIAKLSPESYLILSGVASD